MAEVTYAHIDKHYGDGEPVVRDFSLDVHDQEFLVLVGPSGCGKTTVLRMTAGLEAISDGELIIGGRMMNDVASKDRDIAMVFQNYALYPHMTVYDNMAFSLKLRHIARDEIQQRVARASTMLGIHDYLQRKPKQLSGGQRQRVALGRALVREPQLFLLDEPLSNLDAKLRVQTRADIKRLHQAMPVTTIYVTHDQVEAMTMGDRIAVMNGGVIQQLGAPDELYNRPANLFVAGFIGSPSMNFFAARLRRASDGLSALIGAGTDERTLRLPPTMSAALAEVATTADSSVVLGIRPEHLRVESDGAANTLAGVVDVVEHLGNEQLIYLRIPGAKIAETAMTQDSTARVGPDVRVQPGERLALAVTVAQLHVFDPVTAQRLC